MARITDENKMKLIKKTLIDIIVMDGSSHASIAKMAKKAGVSSGYIYRHYDSKESLLNDLYQEKFELIHAMLMKCIQNNSSLEKFLYAFHYEIVQLTKSNENEVLFLLKMMTDYSIKLTPEMKNQMYEAIETLKQNFKKEISPTITGEQLFTQMLGSLLLFINMRKREVFKSNNIQSEEIKAFSQMILKTLQ